MTPLFARLIDALDARVGVRRPARALAHKVFPTHWSFLLGEIALFSFAFLVVTGLFLTFFYRASIEPVVYTGSAALYEGRELPAAFESIVRISHDVPGGLFVRRLHRGAAQLFVFASFAHLLRIVLAGSFRRPREVNYHLGFVLLLLGIAAGYSGHNLVWDVLSGTSLRIFYTFLAGVPLVGGGLVATLFGGPFPGELVPRLFVLHVLILPVLLAGGIGLHLLLVFRQTHTQEPRPGVDEATTVVGERLWPGQAVKSTTLALSMAGLLSLSAVLVPWSDVDLHGPYRLAQATNASQPDWFLFWVEGALRIYPGIEWTMAGVTVSGPFVVGVVLPLLLIAAVAIYPWLEQRVHPPTRETHGLQHPMEVPFRTGMVAGMLTFMLVLTAAAGNDVIARLVRVPVETVVMVMRYAVVGLPILVGGVVTVYARSRHRLGAQEVSR